MAGLVRPAAGLIPDVSTRLAQLGGWLAQSSLSLSPYPGGELSRLCAFRDQVLFHAGKVVSRESEGRPGFLGAAFDPYSSVTD